jgi:hypothetical protein
LPFSIAAWFATYSSNLEALFATILQFKALLDIAFLGETFFDTFLALETLIATPCHITNTSVYKLF